MFFPHNLSCNGHIIHQMLGIGIGSQGVHTIGKEAKIVFCQCCLVKGSCICLCLGQQDIIVISGFYQLVIGYLQGCTKGEDACCCVSLRQITAGSNKLTIKIDVIIASIPQKSKLYRSRGQIQLLIQIPYTLSGPIIAFSGLLVNCTHSADLLFGGHIQIEFDHFLTVAGHQTELRILFVRTDTGNLRCQLQIELLCSHAFNISIQRSGLACIHNKVGVLAFVRLHIQHIAGVVSTGAAKEFALRIYLRCFCCFGLFFFR